MMNGLIFLYIATALLAGWLVSEMFQEYCNPSSDRISRSSHGALEFNLVFWGLMALLFGWETRDLDAAWFSAAVGGLVLAVTARRYSKKPEKVI